MTMHSEPNMPSRAVWFVALIAMVAAGAVAAPVDRQANPFAGLSDEQLSQLVRDARSPRLAREREAADREIAAAQIYDAESLDQARNLLAADTDNTPAGNVRSITAAFAAADARVRAVTQLMDAAEPVKAANAAKGLVDPEGRRYVDAVARLLHGDALRASGKTDQAAQAYVELVRVMPQRVSFAATAALRAAEAYEQTGRMMHAAALYTWWVDNYSFLDPARVAELTDKAEAIRRRYDKPLATLSDLMGQVQTRLEAADSGEQTQKTEREIVTMMADLIAMAQEQQNNQNQNQQNQNQNQNPQNQDSSSGARPMAIPRNPMQPAERSALPGGEAAQPAGLTTVRPDNDSDAWGNLPIRQREQLIESFRQRYPQRYTEMLEAYYRRLAEPAE